MHVLTRQKLGGVWRCRTSQEQIEVLVNARRTDCGVNIRIGYTLLYQQLGDTLSTVFNTEQATQGWLTDIETAEDNLLTQQGERHSKVGCKEGLTLT